MNLEGLHKDFCKYFSYEKDRTARTIQTYCYNFSEFLRYLEHNGIACDISALQSHRYLQSFMYSLLDRRLHRKSVRQRMLGLKSFCKYLVREDIISRNPFDRFDIPRKEKSLPRPLTDHVRDRLLKSVKKHFEKTRTWRDLQAVVLVELGYKAGMRKGAVQSMTWENTDLKRGFAMITDKGEKKKKKKLVKSVVFWLRQLKLSCECDKGAVILSPRSKTPISDTSFHDEFKRCVRLAGLDTNEISYHSLRHTFGTFLHRKGFGLKEIQEAMGHEDISSTLCYVEVGKELEGKLSRAFANEK